MIGYGPELQRALLALLGFDGLALAERWSKLLLLSVGALLAGSLLVGLQLAWRRRRRSAIDEAAREFTTFAKRLARIDVAPRAAARNAGPRCSITSRGSGRGAGVRGHSAARAT